MKINPLPFRQRSEKECPVCNKTSRDLPKHLRELHGWSRTSSKNAIGLFGMRKKQTPKKSRKYKHTTKVCPFPDCLATTKNPGEHLKSKRHGFKSTDENYKKMLKLFKQYDHDQMIKSYKGGSPLKATGVVEKKVNARKVERNILTDIDSDSESDIEDSRELDCEPFEIQEHNDMEEQFNEQHDNVEDQNGKGSISNTFSPEVEKLIKMFIQHMTGPYRGRKASSVKTVTGDVRRILRVLNIKGDLNPLITSDKVLLKYVEHCERKKHLAGTIKTYLGSLMDFLQFLAQCKDHSLNILDILRTEKMLVQWKKKFNKRDKLQSHRRKEEDRQMIVTRGQVSVYDNGKAKEKALQIFADFKTDPTKILKRSELTAARDCLIVEIGLANAHRSGVTVHMTMKEYKGRYFEDGFYKVPVWNHKTVEAYGAAPVHLRSETFDNLKVFADIMRPKLNPTCEEVFVTWGKKPLQDSDPSKALHKVWSQSGNFDGRELPKNLCMNHVRKTISTRSRQEKNPYLKEISTLMAHSEKTANTHYDIYERGKACSIGAQEVEHLFRGKKNLHSKKYLPI